MFAYLIIFTFFSGIFGGAKGQASDCQTANREPGKCVLIEECQPIWFYFENDFKSNRRLPPKKRNLLRMYSCINLNGKEQLVCCSNKYLHMNEKMTLGITTENPPVISNHENLKLLPSECGRSLIDDKIRNGKNAQMGQFPWMALLFFQKEYEYSEGEQPINRCSGTIINERYILTAAHCICDLQYKLSYVRVGEHDLSTETDCEMNRIGIRKCASPVQNLHIEEIILHPNHDLHDDIALLRTTKMNFSVENVRPICLPVSDELGRQQSSKHFIVTGWGVPFKNAVTANSILQRVELDVVDPKICMERYRRSTMITSRQICAGGSKSMKSTCPGDSGGPLQTLKFLNNDVRYVQEGIVSFGPSICGKVGAPTVNTRVDFYLDWILDAMRP